jgi:hypothetical protein
VARFAFISAFAFVIGAGCTFGPAQHAGEGEGEGAASEGEGGLRGEGEGEGAVVLDYEFETSDGTPIAHSALNLGSIDLGSVPLDVDLLLKNKGATDFAILSDPPMLVAGRDAQLFSVKTQPPDVVPAGQAVPFTIEFAPTGGGSDEAKFLFAWGVSADEREVLTVDATAAGGPPPPQNGINDSLYVGAFTSLPDFSTLTPTSTGTLVNFDIAATAASQGAIVFSGFVLIEADGDYTFFVTSDDGSRLSIDGAVIVNDDGDHAATEVDGTATGLTAGEHAIEVDYYNDVGTGSLTVEWQGPTFARETVPDDHLFLTSP